MSEIYKKLLGKLDVDLDKMEIVEAKIPEHYKKSFKKCFDESETEGLEWEEFIGYVCMIGFDTMMQEAQKRSGFWGRFRK